MPVACATPPITALPPGSVCERTDLPNGIFKIITPYAAEEWSKFLVKCGLLDRFPHLVNKFRFGFSIGDNLPNITRTTIVTNHKSALDQPAFVKEYIEEESHLGRLEGPYTQMELETRLGSPFRSSPLGVVDKAGGKHRMIRDLSYRGSEPFAINDLVDSDDFPTDWGTAADMAELVSNTS